MLPLHIESLSPDRTTSLFPVAGYNADVGNAGLLDGVHDRCKCAEGDFLIRAQIDDLLGVVAAGLFEAGRQVGEVDGLIAEEDALFAVDGDDQALFGDFADGFRLGNGDLDAGLQTGAEIMKITSSTSTTSTSGVMLMSARAVWVWPLLVVKATGLPLSAAGASAPEGGR